VQGEGNRVRGRVSEAESQVNDESTGGIQVVLPKESGRAWKDTQSIEGNKGVWGSLFCRPSRSALITQSARAADTARPPVDPVTVCIHLHKPI
jgi:hypothetical protein